MDKGKAKVLEGGRLVVEPYPSKSRFAAEANRTDCGSYPVLHVDIGHDTMTTVELFELLHHEFPPCNVNAKTLMRYWRSTPEKAPFGMSSLVSAANISLNAEHKRNWSKPAAWMQWISPQIELWTEGTVTRDAYRLWILWCKKVLKRHAMYARKIGGEVYNPFSGLRLRVRIEFHD